MHPPLLSAGRQDEEHANDAMGWLGRLGDKVASLPRPILCPAPIHSDSRCSDEGRDGTAVVLHCSPRACCNSLPDRGAAFCFGSSFVIRSRDPRQQLLLIGTCAHTTPLRASLFLPLSTLGRRGRHSPKTAVTRNIAAYLEVRRQARFPNLDIPGAEIGFVCDRLLFR